MEPVSGESLHTNSSAPGDNANANSSLPQQYPNSHGSSAYNANGPNNTVDKNGLV